MAEEETSEESTVAADLSAALVVVLISIPLSMGIAIASGVPPAYGLVTAAIGGIVTGSLAGCPLQITGPSAGLAVMVMEVVNKHGLEALMVVGLVAGVMQVVAGRLRLGQLFRAVSPAVIRGMLAGIGVLIFASQFHVMVDDLPKGSGLQNLVTIPAAIVKGAIPDPSGNHRTAAAIGMLTLLVIMLVQVFKKRLPKNLQAPLVAVVVATVVARVMELNIKYVSLGGNPFAGLSLPDFGMLATRFDWGMIGVGLALGFVASAETLLCSTAVDGMQSGQRTDYDQELFAQGVGNLLCGLFGVLPTTGVITRSTANVEAGAKTRWAAIVYGIGLLVMVSLFPHILEMIPTASLAGVLVYIGYKLVYTTPLEVLRRYGRSEVGIYAATLISIVSINLLTGLMIGFALAVAKLLYTFNHLEVRVETAGDGQTHVHLDGSATFIRLPRLAALLDGVPPEGVIHVHVHELDYIDHACLDLLASWEQRYNKDGARVFIEWTELADKYHQKNRRFDPSSTELPKEGMQVSHLFDEAVEAADVVELGADSDFEHAVERVSELLGPKLGEEPEDVGRVLLERATGGGCVVLRGMAIPHLHADGIEAPVVVLARVKGGIEPPEGLGEETIHGFFFLASPEGEAAQHLHMLSQLARRIGEGSFLNRWTTAPEEQDLRECLLSRRVILSLSVGDEGPSSDLIDTPIREVTAKKDCFVSLLIRGGEPMTPHGGTRLAIGDQVVLVGEPATVESVRQRFAPEQGARAQGV